MRRRTFLVAAAAASWFACSQSQERAASYPSGSPTRPSVPAKAGSPTRAVVPDMLQRAGLGFLVGSVLDTARRRDSIKDIGGWMIGDAHAVTWAQFHAGQILAFDTMVGRSGQHALWKVLDAVWMPVFDDSLIFVEGCLYENHLQTGDSLPDDGLMGIAVPRDSQWLSKVELAWRADTATGHFHMISATDLRCFNKGYGAD